MMCEEILQALIPGASGPVARVFRRGFLLGWRAARLLSVAEVVGVEVDAAAIVERLRDEETQDRQRTLYALKGPPNGA